MDASQRLPISYLPWIAAGGGLGAVARFALSGWVTTWAGASFPWGTFAANVIGSAVLGLLVALLARTGTRAEVAAFFTAGVCGGFTTFSTFDYEVLVLLQQGRTAAGVVYATASAVACIAGLALGLLLGGRPARFRGTRQRRLVDTPPGPG